jgi:hypothetical protein
MTYFILALAAVALIQCANNDKKIKALQKEIEELRNR